MEEQAKGTGLTPTVPISIALVAGGLAVVNPCGFPLLPAFLSYYLGAQEGPSREGSSGERNEPICSESVLSSAFLASYRRNSNPPW